MMVFCPDCEATEVMSPHQWRCRCGGAWEPSISDDISTTSLDQAEYSVWRYRRWFGLDFAEPGIRLGAGWTPMVRERWNTHHVHFKLEFLAPTGSFKDRGAEVMINAMAYQGVNHIADDSSGNAGASVAAYAAKAGMVADIYVPQYASPEKRAQIAVYGAHVYAVPGRRQDALWAALEATERGIAFASHAYHPAYLAGQQSIAWEIWEQLGHHLPNWVVVPLGQGVHMLGLWLGFRRLLAAGLTERLPRLVGVQVNRIAPICEAFALGLDSVTAIESHHDSVAEGLAVDHPIRGRRVLEGMRETKGVCIVVDDDSILEAQLAFDS